MGDAKKVEGDNYRILVVDDEPSVLNALGRCLKQEGYQMDFFTDPVAALEQARQIGYDLVLSDYKMPNLDGVMMLSLIRQIQPQAKRLILSGESDREALVAAINHANVERFIVKPCDPQDLRFELRRALNREQPGPA